VKTYWQKCEQDDLIREYFFNVEHIGRLSRTFSDLIAQRRLKADQGASSTTAYPRAPRSSARGVGVGCGSLSR
jgi:hypothetical protein